ncbi:MAG: DegV family protein [Clostridiales bacterium]|nr:DegV family protein [Clostridiales bacterium]
MNNFTIVVDSASDLPLDFIKNQKLKLAGLKCIFKDKEYIEDDTMELTYDEFYKGIREGEIPQTSQVNTFNFFEIFESIVKEGNSVIYPAFSSALSGTMNSAILAREDILEKYPNADITIIDTKCASLGYGLVIIKACQLVDNGATKEEIISYINETCPKMNHIVLLDDLNYLKKGGRLSGAAATLGSILQLKPLVKVDNEGKLINFNKVKGRKKGLNFLLQELEEKASDLNFQEILAISHSDCLEDAEKLATMIKEKYNVEVFINYIGCVIGSHTGANTIALFFLGKDDNR